MRSLNRSITVVYGIFILILSLLLSVATYRIYTSTMFDRYQKQMASMLTYIESHIDKDDMGVCARTFIESEKYQAFQAFFDDFIDHYEDVHYLYIMQIGEPGEPLRTREICAANSTYEKEYEPDLVLHLGDAEAGWMEADMEDRFYEIQLGDEDVYLINRSEWGIDYTLARPLVTSDGDHYGILCADVSIEQLNSTIYRNIYINIAVILIPSISFILLLLFWIRSNVTKPLRLLHQSVTDFANTSTGKRNPDELIYNPPDIKAKNEVRAVADAVKKLSLDMRDYVKRIIAAEDETKGLQTRVYQDALTKVKNMAAFKQIKESLDWDIQKQNTEFGIMMVDLNDLKMINDQFGHEHGNEYIRGACMIICDVFKHSSVYRIGGDEFVALLQRADYHDREQLLLEVRKRFQDSFSDTAKNPWQRYSAAIGIAVYEPGDDVEAVFNRADQAMYQEKARMKAKTDIQ